MKIAMLFCFGSLFFFLSCQPVSEPELFSYPLLETLKPLQPLPDQLYESSGLFLDGELIWSHNDSGDRPFLYAFNPEDKKLARKVFVYGAKAIDWEAAARDNQYVYIGDVGNNNGRRKNLTIYKLALDSLRTGKKSAAIEGAIYFNYADQTRFDVIDHNFDCEAMIATPDSLYLFSKNWGDDRTNVYRLPKKPGKYTALRVASFNTDGMVTAASYLPAHRRLCLLGYRMGRSGFSPFIWLFDDFTPKNWFRGSSRRFDLPVKAQMEAVAFQDSSRLLISCEKGYNNPGLLYSLDVD